MSVLLPLSNVHLGGSDDAPYVCGFDAEGFRYHQFLSAPDFSPRDRTIYKNAPGLDGLFKTQRLPSLEGEGESVSRELLSQVPGLVDDFLSEPSAF
jgi:hypothetical protein